MIDTESLAREALAPFQEGQALVTGRQSSARLRDKLTKAKQELYVAKRELRFVQASLKHIQAKTEDRRARTVVAMQLLGDLHRARRWSLEQISREIGASSVCNWWSGKRTPSWSALNRLKALAEGDPHDGRESRIEAYAAAIAAGRSPW